MSSPRAWYDVLLLAYLALFFWGEALLLRRETRLGWAMLGKCLFLGTLFAYVAAVTVIQGNIVWCWCLFGDPVLMGLRLGVAVALTWALGELLRANIRKDPWP